MLKLISLISLCGIDLGHFKIHCALGKINPPLERFFAGTFKQWQEEQNKKNFQCEKILSLIQLNKNLWLFAGVYAVEGVKRGTWKKGECYQYKTHEIGGLESLTGRVIVRFDKNFRATYLRGKKFIDQIYVDSIRDKRMTIGDFPGYHGINLSYRMLKTIVHEANPYWLGALKSVAGVYLVVDTSDGGQYVGSAYGGDGIWKRWQAYCKTGHGGNKELRRLLKRRGLAHAERFQYSLLEVCDLNASDDYIISREKHWKDVLLSRKFGLNDN
jgi:hypothetical protein